MLNIEPAMCANEEPGNSTSAGESWKPLTRLAMIQPKVSCVCVTPFGRPVLPLVKKMNIGASAAGAANSLWGSPWFSNSS